MSAGRRLRRTIAAAVLTAVCGVSVTAVAGGATVEKKLTASDGAANDLFGLAVDIDGDTAAVGASEHNQSRGAIYLFRRTGDEWAQAAKLTASDAAPGDALGSSVAIDGDTVVGGAPGDDSSRGSLYTFARTAAGNQIETAKLTAGDGATFNALGTAVAIDADKIVAGAPFGAGSPGAVYTFSRPGASPPIQTAKLTASDGATGANLGASVATDGDTIVAGAPGASASRGVVYAFPGSGGNRMQSAKLTASDASNGDQLGRSVAIQGPTIAAGAGGDDTGRGSVYTFDRTATGDRIETAKLTATDRAANDVLGSSLDLDGDTIVAGAIRDDVGGNVDQGALYIFARTGAAPRTETAKLTSSDGAPGDLLGISAAIDNGVVIGGASEDDVGSNNAQGSVSLFLQGPDGGGGGDGGGGNTTDNDPPTLDLTAKKSQTAGKPLKLTAKSDEACALSLTGSAKPKGEKKGKLKPVSDQLAAGIAETLKLKPSGKLKKALAQADKGKAKVAGACTDAAGNPSQDALKVKLK